MPYVIGGGGGFAIGLFSTFGVKDLLASTQHALALTVFGLVPCLVLVMAMATMDMKTVPKKDGSTFAVGEWAAGSMAFVMLLIGIMGASMFMGDFWAHPQVPAAAFYSVNAQEDGTPALKPTLLINGDEIDLEFGSKHKLAIQVGRDSNLEVRVPTASQLEAGLHQKFDAPAPTAATPTTQTAQF